jgi:hypothetical protein
MKKKTETKASKNEIEIIKLSPERNLIFLLFLFSVPQRFFLRAVSQLIVSAVKNEGTEREEKYKLM